MAPGLDACRAAEARAGGFSSWSVKHDVVQVQPPAEVLAQMLTICVHLDDNDGENEPLRYVPGLHKSGRLSKDDIRELEKSSAVTCLSPAGSALLMQPLVVHSCSSCMSLRVRRVIHLEFAKAPLPGCPQWTKHV